MQTLTITPPEGFEVDFNEKSREIKFKEKPKDICERINSVLDVLNYLGDSDPDVIDYKKLLTLFDGEHHLVNYQLAILIVKAMNEKRVPNWDDNSTKWTLYFIMGGSSGFRAYDCDLWRSYSHVGSRLCFMEQRLGLHAKNQPEFLKVFERFMTIKK